MGDAERAGDSSIFSGRTVFITGHSGFIGAWLATVLDHLGATVVGYSVDDDPSSATRAAWLADEGVQRITGDVRDRGRLFAALELTRPDIVFHLAAQAILCRGFDDPHLTFDVNLNGSLNMLEAERIGLVPALVHVTSDKCYVPMAADGGMLTEDSPIGGRSPYSASKSMAENMFREFMDLPRLGGAPHRSASVRLGNVIGGGDDADRLVPNCVRFFQQERVFAVRDPLAVRPFQHVLDVVDGFVRLGARLLAAQEETVHALNFAPPTAGHTAGEMVFELARAWGDEALISPERDVCGFLEDKLLWLDGSRAAELLDWHHAFDLRRSAERIVDWVRSVDAGATAAVTTRRQVAEYYLEPVRAIEAAA
ncbi:NAD-dependent epimerase/dehydratase family protein [Demequina iriomotensis]|uniref:NAD-dependent epimerase/dehydratase family protein n=1 Tax=Demequina iriomotensis TaxID=1536641 RepID=UPI0009E50C06|nr:NAD-dependent epimerase/dehydratase family protein [Demequina iriomotensis]